MNTTTAGITTAAGASSAGVQNIVQLHIPCQDVARCTAFYRDVLGLPFLFESNGLAFLMCGSVRLMLSRAEQPELDHPASITYFGVSNIQASSAALGAAGFTTSDPHVIARVGTRDVWLCDFKDSEGNLMALMEERPVTS